MARPALNLIYILSYHYLIDLKVIIIHRHDKSKIGIYHFPYSCIVFYSYLILYSYPIIDTYCDFDALIYMNKKMVLLEWNKCLYLIWNFKLGLIVYRYELQVKWAHNLSTSENAYFNFFLYLTLYFLSSLHIIHPKIRLFSFYFLN
jgi:hypothetical protein